MERSENNITVNRGTFCCGPLWMSIVFLGGLLLVPVWALERESVRGHVMATQIFHHPDPDVLDGFGMSMAGNQHMVLVGAPNEVQNGHEAGRAYVVDRKTGHLIHALGLPRPTGGALFGQSVALNSRYAAIGAPHGRDGEGTYTGGVYVYDQVTGKHTRTITTPIP